MRTKWLGKSGGDVNSGIDDNAETAEKVGVDKSASVRYNIVGDESETKPKSVKWRTDLNKGEFKTLMKEVKRAVWRDECHITDTADWLMTKISSGRYPNGIDVFAMYSTENPDDPTVLYESKGKKALIEKAALEIALEEKQNGYVYEKSTDLSSIRIVDRLQPGENGYHTVGHLVPGSRGRNDRTLRKNLPGRPRGAFESVLGNLFEIQDRDRRSLPTGRGDGGIREYRSGVPGGRETGKYGADILSGDSGWRRDASAGEQARGLRGDERETQGRDRAERRLFARRLLAGGKTEEITDGTHKYSLVKTDAYNDDMKSIAEKAGEMGVEVGFFVGNALRKFDGRRNFLIDGIKLGNSKVLLRYDGEYAPQTLLMHEDVHLSYGSPDAEEAKNAILSGLTGGEKEKVLSEKRYRDYAALYHGNEDAVLEEFVADVLSGMSDYTERFADAVDRYRNGDRHGYGQEFKNAGDGETKYILTGTGTEGDGRRADIPTGEENRWTAEPTAEKKNTGVTLSDIVKDISGKFGIPIAKGKVTNREASGIYKEKPEVIRTRIQNDLPTISHELGHHLDKMYGLSGLESIDELMEAVDGEFLERYPEGDRPGEAIAEFVRKYLANTNEASRLCPDFYADFVGALSREDLKALNGVASAVNEYLSYTATERYNAAIVSSQKKEKLPFREKWSNLISKLYTDWVDAFHPLEKVMDYVEEVTGEKAEGRKNAYKLATNSMNAHARTQHIICEEFCDLDGNSVPGAKSFIDSIAMVDSKNLQDLDRYLVLRHSLEWIAPEQDDVSVKRVFADDTLEDVDTIKAQIEDIEKAHPEIVTAAENLYEYQNNLLRHFVVPAGGMTDETVNTLNRKYPNYVPFYRAVGKKSTRGAFAKGTFANQKSPINRAKGSGAEIISPLESIIRNTEKMVKFAMRNEVMQVWAEYADKVDGFGQFMEKVPPDSIPHYVSLLGQKESFNDALRNIISNGEDFFAVSGLLDEIFGDSITDFTPVASAKNRIVTVLRKGRPEYYQIHDEEFYSSIAELSPKQVSGILKISQTIMQPMKLLITQNNPIFAATNAIRDFGTAYKLSETGNIARFAAQYVKALGGIISNSDTYKQYKAMGGGHSSELSANIDDISKTLRQVAEKDMGLARRLAYALFVHPVETVAKINDAVESVPRFMEFSRTLDAGGDLQEAIYNADDITTNFKRSGKGDAAKAVNKLIMFNNAAIQGLDKLYRTAAKGDAKRRYKALLKWLLHALLMGVIGYIFNKSVDEEGYKNLSSYKKNNFYNFALGDGYFLSLPKPRENAVLDSFTERLIEYFAGENEEAFYDFGNYLTSQLLPPMFPDSLNPVDAVHSVGGSTVLGGVIDVGFNRDFKGTPIESKYDENLPSNERYTENTSKLAYALGQTWPAIAADMSPKKIDHLISSYTGILGQANKALFPVGDSRRDTTIGLRNKFISDSNYSTDVLNRLYENRDMAKKRFNYDKTVGSAVEYEKNAVITSYISEMNKAINALPEDERRGGRAYLLKKLNSWEYGDTSAQSKMIAKLDGSDVNTDVIFTELPSSSLEWTVDGQKYVYRMTPQEYSKYVSDYLTVVENARKYYGKGTVESYEAAKQAAKDYMSEYKKSVLKDKYFKKSTAKVS